MKRPALIHAFACAAAALSLAACDTEQNAEAVIDPSVALQQIAARIDPDKALAEKVESALGFDTGIIPYGIEVTASQGTVQLWGKVESAAIRKRLAIIAGGVVGVKAIENWLVIDPDA